MQPSILTQCSWAAAETQQSSAQQNSPSCWRQNHLYCAAETRARAWSSCKVGLSPHTWLRCAFTSGRSEELLRLKPGSELSQVRLCVSNPHFAEGRLNTERRKIPSGLEGSRIEFGVSAVKDPSQEMLLLMVPTSL